MRKFIVTFAEAGLSLAVALIAGSLLLGVTLAIGGALGVHAHRDIWDSTKSADFELTPASEQALDEARLLQKARALGDEARIDETAGQKHLIVNGIADVNPLAQLLRDNGYRVTRFEFGPNFAVDTIMDAFGAPSVLAQMLLFQMLGLVAVAYFQIRRHSLQVRFFAGRPFRELTQGLGVGVLMIALGAGMWALLRAIGMPVTEQPWIEKALHTSLPMTIIFTLLIGVGAPISEELFFRAYLFRFFGRRLPGVVAYLGSAAMFAGVHFNPSATLIYFAFGLVLCHALKRTSSLAVPIAAHSANNLLAVALVLV